MKISQTDLLTTCYLTPRALIAAILLLCVTPSHAQSVFVGGAQTPSAFTLSTMTPADVWSLHSLSDVQLTAFINLLDNTPTTPAILLPGNGNGGNYWSLQHPEWPPLPGDISQSPVWPMTNNSFLLNDLNVDYETLAATNANGGHQTRDISDSPPSPDGGTNTVEGSGSIMTASGFSIPNYGTNLWIAQTAVSNSYLNAYLTGIGTNTITGVQYEIQSRTNLSQTDWQSEGFISGSASANWTPLSVIQNSRTNLFIQLRSWQSSDGSGLPDWWELQYFGTTGISPTADPDGDGLSNYQEFMGGTSPNVPSNYGVVLTEPKPSTDVP